MGSIAVEPWCQRLVIERSEVVDSFSAITTSLVRGYERGNIRGKNFLSLMKDRWLDGVELTVFVPFLFLSGSSKHTWPFTKGCENDRDVVTSSCSGKFWVR